MKIGDCSMNLKLHFKNIKHNPCCKIRVNNTELYAGTVNSFYNFDIKVDELVTVEIEHYDKKPTDTIVDENGTIIDDRSCLLYTSPSPRDMRRSRMPSSA